MPFGQQTRSPTVSSKNRYVYFLNGSGGLNAYALTPGASTGTTFAAELAAKSGRSCTYQPISNSIQLGYADGTRIVWNDEELSGFLASAFPLCAPPHDPKSINDILGGDAVVGDDGTSITFPFVTMAPLQDLYLTSHQLMVHESFLPLDKGMPWPSWRSLEDSERLCKAHRLATVGMTWESISR